MTPGQTTLSGIDHSHRIALLNLSTKLILIAQVQYAHTRNASCMTVDGRQKNICSKVRASQETVPSALTHRLCYLGKGYRTAGCCSKAWDPCQPLPSRCLFQYPIFRRTYPSPPLLITFSVRLLTLKRAGLSAKGYSKASDNVVVLCW